MKNKAKFSGNEDESALKKIEENNLKIIDPLTKKRLLGELKQYMDDIAERKKKLENLMTVMESTRNELNKVNNKTAENDSGFDIEKKIKLTQDDVNRGGINILLIFFIFLNFFY